ncbi:MAG: hypothetical protein SGPRY_000622 [Prymnesium sp.]
MSELSLDRSRASFDTAEMSSLLYGGAPALSRMRKLRALIEADPVFDKSSLGSMNHSQLYESALLRAKHFAQLMRKHNLPPDEEQTCYESVDASLPFDVHRSMFIPTLAMQTTPEQRERWLPLAQSFTILGAYAQTELGHGSNVRAIETTATYLPASEEFELHSPTLSSTKWWPGGLGLTATHAIVYARLLLRGVDLGVHGFFVQLRSLEDHSALPGVCLGDIGPKLGLNELDNGFASFNRLRIPRDAMLMRFAKVTAEGEYIAPSGSHAKLGYLTMMYVRAVLVRGAGAKLARALTIAVRYSVQRKQGGELGAEPAVLEYASQQGVLFPLIATSYALHFSGSAMFAEYQALVGSVNEGDASRMGYVHAQLAGLKALATYVIADGIEAARRACGGHGYLLSSGLPILLNSTTAFCTLEGTRDAARYFLKQLNTFQETSPPRPLNSATLEDLPALEAAFKLRAHLITLSTQSLLKSTPWNEALIELARVSRAHCHHTLISCFRAAVERTPVGPHKEALSTLALLFTVGLLQENLADFLEEGLILKACAPSLRALIRSLLARVRPDAVALVEAWDFTDHLLDSAIGSSDGRIYERLLQAAKREPLNHAPVGPRHEKLLRPLMLGKL